MRKSAVLLAGSLVSLFGLVTASQAQTKGGAPAAAALKQVAYLKASNPHANDHFGNGGTLEGHGVALTTKPRTHRDGAHTGLPE